MKLPIGALMLVSFQLMTGDVWAADEKVVVQDLAARGVQPEEAAALSTKACSALSKRKGYSVLCGDDLRALMQWNAIASQLNACDSNDCYDAAGKALKARYVVSGNVAKVGEDFVLTIAMFDVVKGTAIGRGEVKATSVKKLYDQVEEAIDVVVSDQQKK